MLSMKFWKRLLSAAITAGLHLAILAGANLAQSISYLFWPSLVVRVLALVLAAPALAVRGLVDVRLQFVIPTWICFLALHFTLPFLWERMRRLWKVFKSPTVRSRRALFVGTGVLVVGAAGVAKETNHLEVRRKDLELSDLPKELHGLKIALLADLHRGPAVTQSYLEHIVDTVNSLEPDLILMPGDFISKSPSYFPDLQKSLERLRPRIGTFATLGNHDIWEGRDLAIATLEAAGVELLQNRCVYVSRNREVSSIPHGLCLAGVDDLWEGEPDLETALGSVPQELPVILLSHNPDVAESETSYRVDVQFSGHTHGGQIVLPTLGPMATASAYGTKYISGWAEGPRWRVFTTVGVGTSSIPVRIGARPEILLFKTVGAELTSRQKN